MGSVLLVLQLIVAIFLVAVILMQRSNGGALSGLGGDGGIGGLLSARGKGNILTRTTAVLATLFFVLSMALSIYFSRTEVHRASIVDATANTAVPVEAAEEAADVEVPVADVEVPVTKAPVEPAPVAAEALPIAEPEVPTAEAPIAPAPVEPVAPAPVPDVPAAPSEPEVPVAE